MPKLMTFGVLVALATVLCGFSDVEFSQGVYRGEPVRDVIARFGRPIETAYLEGRRIYYWRRGNLIGETCKIWGAAQHGIIVNWGYRSCAF
jgi:hypothetical protein